MQPANMGQKQTRYTVPTGEACRRVDICQDESVLILLQHCRDIKQQDARFRLVSLLLLLGCVSFFIFLQLRENYGSIRQENAEPSSPAYSMQECPSADSQSISNQLPIALTSEKDPKLNGSGFMKWKGLYGKNYNQSTDAIEIPEDGYYFVYVRITFQCQGKDVDFKNFILKLKNFIEGHRIQKLTTVMDSVDCRAELYRTLSVGELYELSRGNRIKVFVEGEEMITKSVFGAFFVHK